MSDYAKCPICREYGWLGSHRCPPMWEARLVTKWVDDWSKVRGSDAQEAAVKFAEQHAERKIAFKRPWIEALPDERAAGGGHE